MIKHAPPAVTNASTLAELEARVQAQANANPRIQRPQFLTAPLASTATDLGQVAEACDRQFTAAGDRDLVRQKIGRSLAHLTLVAQASGSTLAQCIEAYRATLNRPPAPKPPTAQLAS